MKALFYTGAAQLEWQETPNPKIQEATDAIVMPRAVAACDLDRKIARGAAPMPPPFILGHEFSGDVIQVGENVDNLKVGDRVMASFQPSCGGCYSCAIKRSSACQSVPPTSMYGIGVAGGNWAGAMADQIRVPWADVNLKVVPGNIDLASLAPASDNLADGLRAVDVPLQQRPGASVLVAGDGSIALYTVLCALFLGSEEVSFASSDDLGLQIAESLGATCLPITKWPRKLASHEITMDCTNNQRGLSTVVRSTKPAGICTSGSIYFGADVPMPLSDMYMKGISFHTGRVDSASQLDRVVDLIQSGLDLNKIQPAYLPMDDAIDALASMPISRKLIFKQ